MERLDRWRLDPGSEPVRVPAWSQGALIYQIFPERFHNGDPSNDPEGVDEWGSPPDSRRLQGGDLVGVLQKLDYLEGLGVDCLYLNPVFASPSNHRYDAVDYHHVDPILGGNRALAELVDEAHRRGMRVVLDASFNHVHPGFFAFRDLLEKGRASRYSAWFVVRDWPPRIRYRPSAGGEDVRQRVARWAAETGLEVETVPGEGRAVETTYESWYHVPTMPRVDLADPGAREYMLGVATHWIEHYDIDGWRMDVARYVDPDFWNDFRRAVKAVRPDAYLLAEIMGDAGQWLQGDRFDATMNYTFRDLALAFFARDEIDGEGLLDGLGRLVAQYPWAVTLANHNLLGSHDTPRFLTEAGEEVDRLRLATVFQLTFPGAPGIYYGDEVGVTGGPDPENRRAFPWEVVA
ncbi:MAG TPA: glycoside hydrolase family 13 protein, partial [Longimicrobiales bacterium]|nr:glycoside hydrolase family 13 protein [Longimicrobiales bacterium]